MATLDRKTRLTNSLQEAMRACAEKLNQLREKREKLDRQTAHSPSKDKENREAVDLLLQKKMAVESLKYGFFSFALQQIETGGDVQSFDSIKDQMYQDEEIFVLESEIFELEIKNVQTEQAKRSTSFDDIASETAMMAALAIHREPVALSADQLRTRELMARPVKHPYVRKLLNDSRSFESRKMAQFVTRFNGMFEHQKSRPMDLVRQRSKSKSVISPEKRLSVPEFISALTSYIFSEHAKHVNTSEESSMKVELEFHLMPRIYKAALAFVDCAEEDTVLTTQCRKFQAIGQTEMKVPVQFQSPEPVPFVDAISKLRAMYLVTTPLEKLYAILDAAQSVYTNFSMFHPDTTIGGDEFMDVWLYIVLKANIRSLASMIAYIKEYANPDYMHGELGYYFSTVELAAAYIKDLTEAQLTTVAMPISEEPFLVCERSKYKRLGRERPFFRVVQDRVTLKGFRICAVKEWIFSPSHFHHTVAVRGDPNDEVDAMVLKANVNVITVQQRAFLKSVFLRPELKGLSVFKTEYGWLLVATPADFNENEKLTLLPLDNIEQEQSMQRTKLLLTLERLCCGPCGDPSQERNFRQQFLIAENKSLPEAVQSLVKETQILLRLLGFLSPQYPADGELTDVVVSAIKRFQKDFNVKESSSSVSSGRLAQLLSSPAQSKLWPTLRTDGLLDSKTKQQLSTRFDQAVQLLTRVGCKASCNPLVHCEDFVSNLKAFQVLSSIKKINDSKGLFDEQDSLNLPATGVISEETLTMLNKLIDSVDTIRERSRNSIS